MPASTLSTVGLTYNNANPAKATAVTVTAEYASTSLKASGYGANVITILAARDKAMYIEGNAKANKITGTSANDTLSGAAGNDTLTGGEGNDIFIYDGQGNDVITDYGEGKDTIKIASGSISSYAFSGSDAIFKVGTASLKVRDGKSSAITIVNSKNKISTYTGGLIYDDAPSKSKSVTVTAAYSSVLSAENYGAAVVTIDASERTKALNIEGNSAANKITGTSANDTINGGAGNDTLTGGAGKDLFIYEGGSGNDVIADYTAGQDTIKIVSGSVSAYSISSSDATLKVGSNTLKVKGIKTGAITVVDENGSASIYQSGAIYNNATPSKASAVTLTSSYGSSLTTAAAVITVDASARTSAIKITGNPKNNFLLGGAGKDILDGGKGADTIVGGKGNDTLTGGAGADIFIYASGDGNDVITDYASGEDVIRLADGEVKSYSVKDGDAILKIASGAITIKGAGARAVSVLDADEVLKVYNGGLIYNNSNISAADAVSITADFDGEFNSYGASVETIDASARSTAIDITGNGADNYIFGGRGKDTISGGKGSDTIVGGKGNDLLTGGAGADVFCFSGVDGNDTITDYSEGEDIIRLTTGAELASYSVKDNDAILKIGSGNVTLKNAADATIKIVGEDGTASLASGGEISTEPAELRATVEPVIPANALQYNGHFYYIFASANSWSGAENFCESLGGYLAAIADEDENAALYDYMTTSGYSSAYFGLTDAAGSWGWANGDSLTYTNWADGEPATVFGGENYGQFSRQTEYAWSEGDENTAAFICEWNGYKTSGLIFSDTDASLATAATITPDFTGATFDAADYPALISITAATRLSGMNIIGNSGDNVITGTGGNDTLTGGEGNDTFVYAGAGDCDVITDYTAGEDIVSIGANSVGGGMVVGNDVIFAIGSGMLKLTGAKNKSITIYSGDEAEEYFNPGIVEETLPVDADFFKIILTNGNDSYVNESSNRIIYALGGNDDISNEKGSAEVTINGGGGSDTIRNYSTEGTVYQLNRGDGSDAIIGYNENDTISVTGTDYTTAKIGENFVVTSGSARFVLRHAANFQVTVKDSSGAVQTFNAGGTRILTADTLSSNVVNTNSRATIAGSAAADYINNYGDSVAVQGGDGADYINNHGANVTIDGGADEDYIWNYGRAAISGGVGDDRIYNYGDGATISGGKGNDVVYMNSTTGWYQYAEGDGNDLIYNFTAADTLQISGSYSTQLSGDSVIVSVGSGKISLLGAGALSTINIVDAGASRAISNTVSGATVRGTEGDDSISNSGDSVEIYAMAGDDSIWSSGGGVTINGGAGDDMVYLDSTTGVGNVLRYSAGDGSDVVYNFASHDTLQISGGYGVQSSGSEVVVSIGSGSITLKDYSGTVNIQSAGNGNAAVPWFVEDDNFTGGGLDSLIELSVASSAGDLSMRGGELDSLAPVVAYRQIDRLID